MCSYQFNFRSRINRFITDSYCLTCWKNQEMNDKNINYWAYDTNCVEGTVRSFGEDKKCCTICLDKNLEL